MSNRADQESQGGPVSQLLLRWEELRQQGRDVTPEELCRDHPDLLETVRQRVAALQAVYGVPNRLPTTDPMETTGPRPPSRVPGYELIRTLGRGGMGVVYLARDARLDRAVALKMILAGADALPSERLRFQVEAEAVAALHHPNIVQVYEVGEADGCPYLALEFVAGGSLADHLRRGLPGPRQAAELVRTLALAVEYAHRQGVVHRDLKPANVLLSPTPKIADFGLAKRRDARAKAHTGSGAVVGTPNYMAPEQAAGKTREVGPAADVYALGGILYECLTGRPPFDADSPLAILARVLEEAPAAPSRVRPGAPRDLETICLKCLEKEPSGRYGSAAELAEDLRRFGAGEPILARPVPAWERGYKWVRRKPALATLAAMLFAVIVGSVVGLSLLYFQAVRERGAALAAQQRAERSEETTKAINGFLLDGLIAAAQPIGEGQGKDVRLVQALDAAEPKIEAALIDQPTVEAGVRHTLGKTYLDLGWYEKARPQFEKAIALRRRVLGEDDRDTLTSQRVLAQLLYFRGNYEEAEDLSRGTYEAANARYGAADETTLDIQLGFANILRFRRKFKEARPHYEEVVRTYTERFGPEDRRTVQAEYEVGTFLANQGEYEAGLKVFEKCLPLMARHHGPDSIQAVMARNQLANTLNSLKRWAEAEPLYEQVLADRRRLYPDAHEMSTLSVLNALAVVCQAQGKLERAEALLRESLVGYRAHIARKAIKPDHVLYGFAQCLLGDCCVERGKYDEAETLLTAGLAVYDANKSSMPPRRLAEAIQSIVRLYEKWGRPEQAEKWRGRLPASDSGRAGGAAR